MHPAQNHRDRTKSYESAYFQLKESLNVTNVTFPVEIGAIPRFEKDNPEFSFMVYGLKDKMVVGPLHATKQRKEHHIQLLYITKGNAGHYCLITNLSRLVGRQLSFCHSKKYICELCLQYFHKDEHLKKHAIDCEIHAPVKIVMPTGEQARMTFSNVAKQETVPFVVYADTECLTTPIQTCQPDPSRSYTNRIQKHSPFAVAYNVVCSYDESQSYFRSYAGQDCIAWLIQELMRLAQKLEQALQVPKPITCTLDDIEHFNRATECHICKEALAPTDVKVYDHCHFTGRYRGAAHQSCNLQFRAPKYIPVFFHNLTGYDSHYIIREFANLGEHNTPSVLPQNHEKFISFSVRVGGVQLRFLDSYRFLPSSLDALVKGLSPDELRHTRQRFPNSEQFTLCVRKGVFPYDHCNSWESLKETALPPQSAFFSILNQSSVSDEDYSHALAVWNAFHINTLGEYADLYLKIDVLLLSDVFEKFRNMCRGVYGLDPGHFYTSPSLSWEAMLKVTRVELDLLTDVDMLLFFERGVRGGFVSLVNRHAVANNEYIGVVDPEKPISHLMYFDVNNLYGYAMSQPLPYKNFTWLSEDDIRAFDVDKAAIDCHRGYVLEVDLRYPRTLHREHADLPFCVERMVPPVESSSHNKLVGTLFPKKRYVLHIQNLKQCLAYGLVLEKIHRVISFLQAAWLEPYMRLNTELRQRSTQEFESNFFKLMNNCIYGKSLENIRKHRDIHLVNKWEGRYGAAAYIAKPNFKKFKIIVEDLVTVELNKLEIFYNRPIYLGMVILDYAKLHMYNFHYGFAKQQFGKVSLMYTDTDSFIYKIEECDAYAVMRDNPDRFDTSSFPLDGNVFQIVPRNSKVIGLMKDECGPNTMTEFVGLACKMYAYRTLQLKEVAKAKGIRTSVTRSFRVDKYLSVLRTLTDVYHQQARIVSHSHEVYLLDQVKRSLAVSDDKRQWSSDFLTSLPWGYQSEEAS